jgi:hypothetical protein
MGATASRDDIDAARSVLPSPTSDDALLPPPHAIDEAQLGATLSPTAAIIDHANAAMGSIGRRRGGGRSTQAHDDALLAESGTIMPIRISPGGVSRPISRAPTAPSSAAVSRSDNPEWPPPTATGTSTIGGAVPSTNMLPTSTSGGPNDNTLSPPPDIRLTVDVPSSTPGGPSSLSHPTARDPSVSPGGLIPPGSAPLSCNDY